MAVFCHVTLWGDLLSGGLENLVLPMLDLANHSPWGLHSGGLRSGGLEHLGLPMLDPANHSPWGLHSEGLHSGGLENLGRATDSILVCIYIYMYVCVYIYICATNARAHLPRPSRSLAGGGASPRGQARSYSLKPETSRKWLGSLPTTRK